MKRVYFNCLLAFLITLTYVRLAKCKRCSQRDLSRVEEGRRCTKSCATTEDCTGPRKRCICDDVCGMSCLNPNLTCRAVTGFENGVVSGERRYKDKITYTCNRGYVLKGNSKRTCRADKKWTGSDPLCVEGCPVPRYHGTAFPNTTKTQFIIGETMEYICRYGYDLSGSPEVECLPGGVWSASHFFCVKKNCGDPGTPLNGFKVGDPNYLFGSKVHFECDKGYELDGSGVVSCTTKGTWYKPELPECTILRCRPPVAPEHGSVDTRRIEEFVYNTKVPYACDHGYKLVGDAVGICNENQTWGQLPVCKVDTDCDFENSKKPTCGYTNQGEGWKRTFSRSVPEGPRGYVARARFTSQQGTIESTLTSPEIPQENSAWCLRFYYKVDDIGTSSDFTVSTIQQGRSSNIWSFYEPRDSKSMWLSTDHLFEASDGLLQIEFKAKKGIVSTAIDLDDVTITQGHAENCVDECAGGTCQNGATCLNRINSFKCFCQDGYEGTRCEIEIRCTTPYPPRHGSVMLSNGIPITTKSLFYGSEIKYTCNYKYYMVDVARGVVQARCQLNRRWTHTRPVCEEIRCIVPHLPSSVQMTPSETSFTLDDEITYICAPTYRMEDHASERLTATCQKDFTWSESVPSCVKIDCRTRRLQNGRFELRRGSYTRPEFIILGGTIVYSCKYGYEMEEQPNGNLSMTCQAYNRWSEEIPTCLLIECDVPESLAHGTISTTENKLLLDKKFTYRCNRGYRMEGQAHDQLTVTCRKSRQWSSTRPTCTLITCPVPTIPAFGILSRTFEGEDARLGDCVSYRCDDGYRLIGEEESFCQRDGTWSNQITTCRVITCDPREAPQNTQVDVTKDRWIVGDVVTYSCGEQHRLSGSPTSICQGDGMWSSEPALCQEIQCKHRNPQSFLRTSSNQTRWSPNDAVIYNCAEGYQLIGEATVRCLRSGSWSGPLPECEKSISKCPNGYSNVGHLCGKAFLGLFNFTKASSLCQTDNANLPIIRSTKVQNIFTSSFLPSANNIWIGLEYSYANSQYAWTSGEPFNQSEFSNFTARHSDNTTGHCVWYRKNKTHWAFGSCSDRKNTVCMKWSTDVRPIDVSFNYSDFSLYNGIYEPVNGMIRSQAPVYKLKHAEVVAYIYRYTSKEGQKVVFWHLATQLDSSKPILKVESDEILPENIVETIKSAALMKIKVYDTWGKWSTWSACDATCDGGMQHRERNCDQGHQVGSMYCDGPVRQNRICNKSPCKAECMVRKHDNGKVILTQNMIEEGEFVTYSCLPGYRASGNNIVTATCQADGSFDVAPPECVEITCHVTSKPLNGAVSATGTIAVGESIIYTCKEGFEMIGQTSGRLTVVCLDDGNLSRTIPQCNEKDSWSEWSEFGDCSVTCGSGQQTRNRRCTGSAEPICPGKATQLQDCTAQPCQGEIRVGGITYTISENKLNFWEARKSCQQRSSGGRLAMIKSPSVQQHIYSVIRWRSELSYYLGMTGKNTRNWFYEDGSRVDIPKRRTSQYSNWYPGEPNNYWWREDCGMMYRHSGLWNDVTCYSKLNYICQRVTDLCWSSPCHNGGICIGNAERYTCECQSGYKGDNCEQRSAPCDSKPCQNKALCNVVEADDYLCGCGRHLKGKNCEIIESLCWSSPCKNGATCRGNIESYNCECETGYKGINCEKETSPCDNNPCQHGAVCNRRADDYLCGCLRYFAGKNCDIIESLCWSSPCQNEGTCRGNEDFYTCQCREGYDGKNCELEALTD